MCTWDKEKGWKWGSGFKVTCEAQPHTKKWEELCASTGGWRQGECSAKCNPTGMGAKGCVQVEDQGQECGEKTFVRCL